MITITIAWIVIFFVLLSFGNILICLYNKICKQKEEYNIPDTLLLGICFILIPISLTSFWLPTNQYTLIGAVLISIFYWIINKKRLLSYCKKIKYYCNTFSLLQKIIFVLFLFSLFIFMLWEMAIFDSSYYHHQNILWNESYPAIPGLANCEDRYGFNSNYFLLSSVFTFRFLFGTPVYALQSIIFVCILLWILKEVFINNYKVKNIVALFFLIILFFTNKIYFANSSTDIILSLSILYIILKYILYPESLKKDFLLLVILPISLVTFKLSSLPFSVISLFVIIRYIKQRNIRPIFFVFLFSVSTVALWCIRNVLISGYLVYPIYEIDLFSYDWKIPEAICKVQRWIMHGYAKEAFKEPFNDIIYFKYYIVDQRSRLILDFFNIFSIFLVCATPLFLIYSFFKKIKNPTAYYLIYMVCLLNLLYWYISAPDYRFASGFIWGVICVSIMMVLGNKREQSLFKRYGNIFLLLCASIFFFHL